eukprot:13797572-Ditylum_brightwellii.AAC.1
MEANDTEINILPFLRDVEDDNMGYPIGSDIEAEEDECGENGDECKICCQNLPSLKRNVADTKTKERRSR